LVNISNSISSGSIIFIPVKKYTDDSIVETIPASNTEIVGNQATISPNIFEYQTKHYIQIEETAFNDGNNNYFSGISNKDFWNFITLSYFSNINTGLPCANNSEIAWGDYDNDGDLDILYNAYFEPNPHICTIYKNNGNGTFTDIEANFIGLFGGSTKWIDYDNDGDLDIFLTGINIIDPEEMEFDILTKIYQNNGDETFSDVNTGLPDVCFGGSAWGDYDNDGDLDVLVTGFDVFGDGPSHKISKIFRNESGSFTAINAGLTASSSGSVAWGDYDNDGDLDILLTGESDSGIISKIYNNDSGTFTDIEAGLTGVAGSYSSSVAWGDYDNDGDLDILLTGGSDSGQIFKIYNNDSGTFTDIEAGLTGGENDKSAAWGDFDNDGDLILVRSSKYTIMILVLLPILKQD